MATAGQTVMGDHLPLLDASGFGATAAGVGWDDLGSDVRDSGGELKSGRGAEVVGDGGVLVWTGRTHRLVAPHAPRS
jgi:hypothetical protein